MVRRGDTLFQIARNHGTTVKALKSENGLKSDVLKAGRKLRIPGAVKNAVQPAESKPLPKRLAQESPAPPQLSRQAAVEDADSEDPSIRHRLVQAGFQFLGVRYRLGSISEKNGFDCSGLVKKVFSIFNIDLPRTSREQFQQGQKVDRENLQKGDLVFFSSGGKTPTHVGIYIGNDKFLHAARKARQVIVSDLNKIWYSMRYLGARRVIWGEDDQPAPEQNQ